MEWVYLIVAGGLEVFWSTCLKLSEGFSVLKFSVLTIIGMVFSFLFLIFFRTDIPSIPGSMMSRMTASYSVPFI